MHRILAALLVLSAFAAPVQAATPAADRAAIEQVIETFRTSLIKKDPASFMKLFYSDSIAWIGVTTDHSLVMMKERKKDAAAPDLQKLDPTGNPRQFIESMANSKNAIEEKFDNVRIESDGDVAQVWFDYSFNINDYKANWGKEAWQLVRAPEGWKISSVIWSMEFNPAPPTKRAKTSP